MQYFHYNIISSTSDYAKLLLQKNNEVIVNADFQTSGRGRNQNSWIGNYGDNMYLSYGINHSVPINFNQAALYQAIGSLSVLNTLKKLTGFKAFRLKYPNDVYANVFESGNEIQNNINDLPNLNSGYYRKISGVLTEHGFIGANCSYSILGIGINVNQTVFNEELLEKATSLKLLKFSVEINPLINLLIDEILFFKNMEFDDIFKQWTAELNIINKSVSVKDKPGRWIIMDVLPDSRLLAKNANNDEETIIDNGDSISYEL